MEAPSSITAVTTTAGSIGAEPSSTAPTSSPLLQHRAEPSTGLQIKLADKQAALEKLEWEAMTSNRKVEKLQEDLGSMKDEIAAFTRLFEELAKSDSTTYAQEKNTYLFPLDGLPQIEPINEIDMQKMEEARRAYVAAVAAARENPSEESLAVAAKARLKLQAFAFGPNNTNVGNENGSQILRNAP